MVLSTTGLAPDSDGCYDFSTDPESIRQFWAVTLGFAAANGADRVNFNCSRADDRLSICTDDRWMLMGPPPADIRQYLFRGLLELLLGPWRSRLLRYTGRFTRWMATSRCLVETDAGSTSWCVRCGASGLAFRREGAAEVK